jgi:uncharacterized protein YodC (DUF2158 family)
MLDSDSPIQIGDIVQLKTGGPKLRVVEIGKVIVEWKNCQNEIERAAFSEINLTKTK